MNLRAADVRRCPRSVTLRAVLGVRAVITPDADSAHSCTDSKSAHGGAEAEGAPSGGAAPDVLYKI